MKSAAPVNNVRTLVTSECDLEIIELSPGAPSAPGYDRGPTDTFGNYLRNIGKTALLTAAEEVDLAKRIEVGLFAATKQAEGVVELALQPEYDWLTRDGRHAKCQFIEANLRLVVSIAKRYSGRGTPIMDLVQDGNIGLVRAVEKFDFTTGYKFSTYATWWIRQAIHRGMADKSRLIRIPVHTAEKLNQIQVARRDLIHTLDREPSVAELAEETHMSAQDVSKLLQYDREPISLQSPVGDGEGEIGDLIVDELLPQPDESAALSLQTADIARCLAALPDREHSILRARFGLDGNEPRTLEQVALVQGVTRERVRQIEKRALAMLHVPRLEHYLTG